MDSAKYVGMDVHKETTSIAVLSAAGKLLMECTLETKANTIVEFISGLPGEVHLTLEEGTWAAWLYDLLKGCVTEIVVCNPRRNALLKAGNKGDKSDAQNLAELLRGNFLRPVYHEESGIRTLKQLTRSYVTISKDLTRVMNRIKAVYRGEGIPCRGTTVYALCHRSEWLGKISESGLRRRAEYFYEQLDGLKALRQVVRRDLLAESRRHPATDLLCQIPCIGPIRAAQLVALMQTPHRFRTKRQFWAYSGLGLETRASAQYRYVQGRLQHSKKPQRVYGLNQNHNHELKGLFKGVAAMACRWPGPFRDFYQALLAKGRTPNMAQLTLARKIAAVTLVVWKREVGFDARHLRHEAA
jgi:transposase